MRVLVAAQRRNCQQNELVDTLSRHGSDTYFISPEDLTPEIVADSDVVLIDTGLPYDAGVTICRKIRAYSEIPIIMMSRRSDTTSRVNGLRSGANDYVATPCRIDEIMAKIAAIVRPRGRGRASGQWEPGRTEVMTVDVNHLKVTIGDKAAELTRREFQVLLLIANENGAACSREKIASELWGPGESHAHDSIHFFVSRLRAKLGHECIKTIRGVGYRLVTPISTAGPLLPDKDMKNRRHLRLLPG